MLGAMETVEAKISSPNDNLCAISHYFLNSSCGHCKQKTRYVETDHQNPRYSENSSDKGSEAILRCLQYKRCAGPQKVSKSRFQKMLTEIYAPKIKIW